MELSEWHLKKIPFQIISTNVQLPDFDRMTDIVNITDDGDGDSSGHRLRLTDLADEVLINIFKSCHEVDIVNLAEAFRGSKLARVIKDQSLWRTAIIGPGDLKKYLKYLGIYTTSLTIIGSKSKPRPKQSGSTLSEAVISSIRRKCSNLQQFTIKNCIIDARVIRFSLFPKTLTHLELANVSYINLAPVGVACPFLVMMMLVISRWGWPRNLPHFMASRNPFRNCNISH